VEKLDYKPVVTTTPVGIACGELLESFRRGALAVIISGDDRIHRLFYSVLDWLGLRDPSTMESFGGNVIDLARNHLKEDPHTGDMLRFQPGVFGHVARKFVVFRTAIQQPIKAFPKAFYVGNQLVDVPHGILEATWTLMSEVLMSVMPREIDTSAYATEVDVLVYPTSSSDVDRLSTLLADSCGAWSRLGHQIDVNKGKAVGVFDKKVVRELFAIASLVPGLDDFVTELNNRWSDTRKDASMDDDYVIGGPHFDHNKYVTGLIGSRYNLQTQIWSANRWVSLPVTQDAITIVPGVKIGSLNNIPPTRHRIVLKSSLKSEDAAQRNVTLGLSVVDRSTNLLAKTIA
jgi:hypothetical protein